jgi:hypothetical protein
MSILLLLQALVLSALLLASCDCFALLAPSAASYQTTRYCPPIITTQHGRIVKPFRPVGFCSSSTRLFWLNGSRCRASNRIAATCCHGTNDDDEDTTDTRTPTKKKAPTTIRRLQDSVPLHAVGLYRPFVDHAWKKLQDTGWFWDDPNTSIPPELTFNVAPAKGLPEGSVVSMETRVLLPKDAECSPVRYARCALLETLVPSSSDTDDSYNSTTGIQVLNLVIFPSRHTNWPVFGADLVSLPGDRSLLLLDAQPMDGNDDDDENQNSQPARRYQDHWKEWYQEHVVGDKSSKSKFEWGGDIPPQVARYVSDYALWTRLGGTSSEGDSSSKSPREIIQTDVWDAYQAHLELYLELLATYDNKKDDTIHKNIHNEQEPYIQYRLQNDPARPMLKSLYGEEWTERVLQEVLFPNLQ